MEKAERVDVCLLYITYESFITDKTCDAIKSNNFDIKKNAVYQNFLARINAIKEAYRIEKIPKYKDIYYDCVHRNYATVLIEYRKQNTIGNDYEIISICNSDRSGGEHTDTSTHAERKVWKTMQDKVKIEGINIICNIIVVSELPPCKTYENDCYKYFLEKFGKDKIDDTFFLNKDRDVFCHVINYSDDLTEEDKIKLVLKQVIEINSNNGGFLLDPNLLKCLDVNSIENKQSETKVSKQQKGQQRLEDAKRRREYESKQREKEYQKKEKQQTDPTNNPFVVKPQFTSITSKEKKTSDIVVFSPLVPLQKASVLKSNAQERLKSTSYSRPKHPVGSNEYNLQEQRNRGNVEQQQQKSASKNVEEDGEFKEQKKRKNSSNQKG